MRVLLADDQERVRSALRLVLEQEPSVDVVGEAADTAALLLGAEKAPDIILLDWELPGLPPAELIALLRQLLPQVTIIGLSSRPESRREARKAGVDTFVSKSDAPAALLAALNASLFSGMAQEDEPSAN